MVKSKALWYWIAEVKESSEALGTKWKIILENLR